MRILYRAVGGPKGAAFFFSKAVIGPENDDLLLGEIGKYKPIIVLGLGWRWFDEKRFELEMITRVVLNHLSVQAIV